MLPSKSRPSLPGKLVPDPNSGVPPGFASPKTMRGRYQPDAREAGRAAGVNVKLDWRHSGASTNSTIS